MGGGVSSHMPHGARRTAPLCPTSTSTKRPYGNVSSTCARDHTSHRHTHGQGRPLGTRFLVFVARMDRGCGRRLVRR